MQISFETQKMIDELVMQECERMSAQSHINDDDNNDEIMAARLLNCPDDEANPACDDDY